MEETQVEQQTEQEIPQVNEKPKVPFNPSLDKFTNVTTPENLLQAVDVLNTTLGIKLKYWMKDGKGNNQLVETSIWTDEEIQFLKGKLINFVNFIQ
jgi:hypothetical protein